MTENNKLMDSV